MSKNLQPPQLRDLPLWRLLVALADAERAFGPTDPMTRNIARTVEERLRECPDAGTKEERGGAADANKGGAR